MPHVEMVGIAFADFGIALLVAAGLAKALGPEDQAIVADLELDVAADRLDIERIVVIPRMDVGLVRGGRRGELVDQRQQSARTQLLRVEVKRKIGRASCRERVCQYVKLSLDAVSLQNNKYTIKKKNYN